MKRLARNTGWLSTSMRNAGKAGPPASNKAGRLAGLVSWTVVLATACAHPSPWSQALAADRDDTASSTDMAVSVARTKNMCFDDTLQVTGVLVPRNEVLVRPDREGLQISQVLVETGATVVSGQTLARLTPPEGGSSVALTAPADGVINARSAVIGTMASARAEPMFRITQKGEVELLAETPIQTLAKLAPDQSATLLVIGGGKLPGKVRLVSTTINPTTQLGQVRLSIGTNVRLHSGAFGIAIIDLGRRCGTSVPLSAVLYGSDGAVVQVVRDGRVETRRVTVGLIAGGAAEIRQGLTERDMVVTRAGAFLREDDRVRPIAVPDGSPARP